MLEFVSQQFSRRKPEWRRKAAKRLQLACYKARILAIASLEPTDEEGLKRMQKIATLCEKLIEALTGKEDGNAGIAKYIDAALAMDRLDERTVSYSNDLRGGMNDALARLHLLLDGLRLIHDRALLVDSTKWDEFVERPVRGPEFFKNALQQELEIFWNWATGEPARFSTPHQKSRAGYLATIPKRPSYITTEKTGPFVIFVQKFMGLLGEYPVTGRSVAGRSNRLKKKRAHE
jgi:hypothetical protein